MRLRGKVKKTASMMTVAALALSMMVPMATPMQALAAAQTKDYSPSAVQYRNVMYYGDWSIWEGEDNCYPSALPVDQLTHLNFAFVDFDAQGNLIFCDKDAAVGAPVGMEGAQWGAANSGILSALQDLRAKNPNLRIGVSLGGWSKSGDFSVVAANATVRAKFVENILKFVKYTNMDFVDLDWEYPNSVREADLIDNKNDEGTPKANPADKANYITLLQDIKTALNKQGTEMGKTYELSCALPAGISTIEKGIDVPKLFSIIDYGNMMTYDLRGAWNAESGHQTALYTNPKDPYKDLDLSVDGCIKYVLSKGAPSKKVVVGAAFYTRGWEKVANNGPDAANPGLFGTASLVKTDGDGKTPTYGADNAEQSKLGDGGRRGGSWGYRVLSKLKVAYPGLQEYWDDVAKAPYLYNKTTGAFFTYDNVRSITEKANYVKANNLGGMIAWMASQDAVTTKPGVRDELTKAMKQGLFGDTPLTGYNIVTGKQDVQTTVTTYSENGSTGYVITIKNTATANETQETLKLVETAFESIKAPRIYIKTKSGATLSSGGYPSGTVSMQNGVGVVDLTSVYEYKTLDAGKSAQIRIKSSTAANVNDIASIELRQRIIEKNGAEISSQVIYGGGDVTPTNTAPVISGAFDQQITAGDAFDVKAGVTATDKEDGDVTSKITVAGTVNTAVAGTYTLTYTVKDSGNLTTTATRVVTVKDKVVVVEKPVISGAVNKEITVGDAFDAKAGVTATDVVDGNVTAKIAVTGTVNTAVAGTYTLTYTVTNTKGATATATRTIVVKAKVVTKATITGVANKTITAGDAFDAKAGVTASDSVDGNITANIVVTGAVDTAKAGTYTLTYSVTNSQGAVTTATCTVTVKAKDVVNPPVTGNAYDPAKAYLAGETVVYNNDTYKAKWWTQGNIPGAEQWGPWELVTGTVKPPVVGKPTIAGVTNKTITVGDAFDAKAGVTATDSKDGNITANVTVTGTVNTAVAGTYTVTYTVANSQGGTATATATITVKAKDVVTPPVTGNEYSVTKVYTGGEIITYQGKSYKAKWWTQGNIPGAEQWGPWELQK